MLPSRFVPAQSSNMRKSKAENRPSMLPKPRRPGSVDRLSTEAGRPSATGHRSSSAEPRSTLAGRLSREPSATKLQYNGVHRSRSQQSTDRYGTGFMTPLRHQRATGVSTTPGRTPSEERASRSWQASLDRALAFVTIKDQRPIASVSWQRAELARVQEALGARGAGGAALVRPLTIARFVDVTGALLNAITVDAKLNTDNYVAKLPHLSKRLLYPGAVSKSWLKTVNTLHAFPSALALIAYLLDMVNHLEMPVCDDELYTDQSELARLRREYLHNCWIRFQESDYTFDDLNEEYLMKLRELLGIDEERRNELIQFIRDAEQQLSTEDEEEVGARGEEARLAARRGELQAALRRARAERRDAAARAERLREQLALQADASARCDQHIHALQCENDQLRIEIESQPMCAEERARLRDEIECARRVLSSKQELAQRITEMVSMKERELSCWQQRALDGCVRYKQGLIAAAAHHTQLATLTTIAIDEKEVMWGGCVSAVSEGVSRLRECAAELAERAAQRHRDRTHHQRRIAHMLDETRAKLCEVQTAVEREQEAVERERSEAASEAAEWEGAVRAANDRRHELLRRQQLYTEAEQLRHYWEQQDITWRTKLSELKSYVEAQQEEYAKVLEKGRSRRSQLVVDGIRQWNDKLNK